MRPRDLPVCAAPSLPLILTEQEMMKYPTPGVVNPASPIPGDVVAANAISYSNAKGKATPVEMLGHSMNAVALEKGSSLSYDFEIDKDSDGIVRVAVIPTHALDGEDLRFSVSVDGSKPEVFSLKEPFRSERWKENVLRGQSIRTVPVSLKAGKHKLEIKALDDNIIVDQWMWDPNPNRKFYLFPL